MSESSTPPFGALLRSFRTRAGFSQDELAERAGVSLAAVSALERGTRRAPQRGTLALLADGLGLGPEERDELLAAASRSRARAHETTHALPAVATETNFPLYLTSFVGRESDISATQKALRQYRLVTIVGAGGLGKTRLACEVAGYLKGVFERIVFADLAPLIDGAMLAPYLAGILHADVNDGDVLVAIAASLADSKVLLIFDNCERLLDAAAATITALLKSCSNVTVVATSRERLSVSGEWIYRLQPLEAIPARDLFVERAQAFEPHFTPREDESTDVADICLRLNGMPLAIELAVARLPTLGIHQLRSRLDERFTSSSGYRDAPARHQTMQATIGWSFEMLDGDERAVIDRAGIFAGGFTLDAAERVFNDGTAASPRVLDILSRLVEKSLLLVRHSDEPSRYQLLEPVRLYSLDRLRESGRFDDVARRHAHWLAERADAANEEASLGFSHRTIVTQMMPELDNIRVALERLLHSNNAEDSALAARIAGGLRSVWIRLSLYEEAARWSSDILSRLDLDRQPELGALVMRLQTQSLPQPMERAMIERAVDVYTRAGDYYGLINMYIATMGSAASVGDFDLANRCDAESARHFASEHAVGSTFFAAYLQARSYVLALQGRFEEARKAFDAASGLDENQATPAENAYRYQIRAQIESFAGNYAVAIAFEKAALETGERERILDGAYCNLAIYYFLNGESDEARNALRVSLESSRTHPHTSLLPLNMQIQVAAAIAARNGAMETAALLKGCFDHIATARKRAFRSQTELALDERIDAAFLARPDFTTRDRFMEKGATMSRADAQMLALTL